MLACLPSLKVGKKKKSKDCSKATHGGKKEINKSGLRVKPIDIFNPSTVNDLKKSYLAVSISFTPADKGSSIFPKILSADSLVRSAGETSYEEGEELNVEFSRPIKKESSDLDFQQKVEITSHGSNVNLNSYVFEELETDTGHLIEPAMELSTFSQLLLLKRSCSNVEIKPAKQWIKSPKMSRSCRTNLHNFPRNTSVEISCETHNSPFSVRTPCSAGRPELNRLPSIQILPSRSRKIYRKLLRRIHMNRYMPKAPQCRDSVSSASDRNNENLPASHKKLPFERNKLAYYEKQQVASLLESSHMDRIIAWVNSLDNCSINSFDTDEHFNGMKDVQNADQNHPLEIEESSEKNNRQPDSMAQTNTFIQSLSASSSVADISDNGLKAIPSISAFLFLRSVILSGNYIVNITEGSLPKGLHTLDLSRNKISTIDGLRGLERLRVLNLSYNRIARISHGLSNCTLIKELYLAGNKISNVEGLHRLLKLTVLDLSFNKLITIKALGQLVSNYSSLLALNLQGNPILANIGDDQLKKAVLSLLPHIAYLNKQPITPLKVREVVSESVAKAALGDAVRTSRRKSTRRSRSLSQRFGDTSSFRARKEHALDF